MTDTTVPHTIVVGVDGSENSVAALHWALAQASLRPGTLVNAVLTWAYPVSTAASYPMGGGLPEAVDMTSNAEASLLRLLDGIEVPEGVELRPLVREGAASSVLIEESRDADLLVIGRRGHGTLLGLLLGSIANQCTHHADCPVVVVPHPA